MNGAVDPEIAAVVAIIPVKSLDSAKSRLATHLSPDERARLVLRLLDNVLAALSQVPAVRHSLVVSRDPRVREHARERGAVAIDETTSGSVIQAVPRVLGRDRVVSFDAFATETLQDVADYPADGTALGGSDRGYNRALDVARDYVVEHWRPGALLVLAADLPRLGADDIAGMIALGDASTTVVIAPDRWDTGTNGLLLRPPDAIAFRFGQNSFGEHCRRTLAAGLTLRLYREPGTAVDIDEPEDIDVLIQ